MSKTFQAIACVALALGVGCGKKPEPPKASSPIAAAQQEAPKPPADQMAPRDGDFAKFLYQELPVYEYGNARLAKYSASWQAKMGDVNAKVAAIADPDLRGREWDKQMEPFREACEKEASATLDSLAKAFYGERKDFWAQHEDLWVPIARFDRYEPNDGLMFFQRDETPVGTTQKVFLDIPNADRFLNVFKNANLGVIQNAVDQEIQQLSGRVEDLRQSGNLSDAQIQQGIRELSDESWKRFENQTRRHGLVIAGRGLSFSKDNREGRASFRRYALMSVGQAKVLTDLVLVTNKKDGEFFTLPGASVPAAKP